jgi:hypothetical protein
LKIGAELRLHMWPRKQTRSITEIARRIHAGSIAAGELAMAGRLEFPDHRQAVLEEAATQLRSPVGKLGEATCKTPRQGTPQHERGQRNGISTRG